MDASDPALSEEMKTIRQRLADIETEVAHLKRQICPAPVTANQPWWMQRCGAFANDPGFDEMVRLGQEWRAADREKAPREPEQSAKP